MRVVGALFFAAVLVMSVTSNVRAEDLTVPIVASPSVVNLDSHGTWVTIHAEIAYSAVSSASVLLNGIPVEWTKSDARGEFVAKFALDDVKAILAPGQVHLTLTGTTKAGESFIGTDTIFVLGDTVTSSPRPKSRPSRHHRRM